MKTLVPFFVVLVTALSACMPATTMNAEVPLGQEFKLKVGQETVVKGEDLALHFQAVTEDSRCPKSVQCVQAGQAKVAVVARRKGTDSPALTLTLNPPQAQNQIVYEGYTIQLKALNPYPETPDKKIEQKDYEATLVVAKP